MTDRELEDIAQRVAVRVLRDLGINADDAFEMRRDFEFVRRWRCTTDSLRGRTLWTVVGTLVAGSLAMIWLGLRSMFSGNS